jgi:PAS domain S-box-containing protein
MSTRLNFLRLLAETFLVLAAAAISLALFPLRFAFAQAPVAQAMLQISLLLALCAPLLYWRFMAAMRRGRPASVQSATTTLRVKRALVMTVAALILGWVVTAGVVLWQKNNLDSAQQQRFAYEASGIESEVIRRLKAPISVLPGLRALYATSGFNAEVSREQFRSYIEARDWTIEFAGVRGFGFIAKVPRAELDAFVAKERADGAPDFAVRTSGTAPDLFVIKFIEPLANNRPAWGFDVGQEAVRRTAAERAVATGESTLTGKITLVQDGNKSPGFLAYVPVYRNPQALKTPEQRQAALVGLVYTPFVASELLGDILKLKNSNLQLALYEGTELLESALIYQSQSSLEQPIQPSYRMQHQFDVGGTTLHLRVVSTAAFVQDQDRSSLLLFGALGVLASFMMAATVWLLGMGRVRALNLATRMTADLDRMARVVRHTDNAVTIADEQGRITWVNAGFTRLSGFEMEEALGKTTFQVFGRDHAKPATLKAMASAASRGLACRIEVLNCAKDGRPYWTLVDMQPSYDDHGAVVGFMEISTDISERMQAQQALIESQIFLDRAGRIAGVGGWRVDLKTESITWSKETRRIHDVDGAFVPLMAQAINFYAPKARPIMQAAIQQALETRQGWDLELPFITSKGRPIWVRTVGEVEFEDDQPVMLIGALQDVTERRQRDEQMQLLQACVNRINDGILITLADNFDDLGPEVVFVNHAFEKLTGYSQSEMLGKTPRILQGPDTNRTELARIKQALVRGEPVRAELINYSKSGEPYWIEVDMSPVLSVTGELTHFVAVERDITERLAQTAALHDAVRLAEEASVSKSQFLANMSHEIRTPMNAILGLLKLMQHTELTSRQTDYVDKTQGAALSLLGLLNDILDFSKVEAGKMAPDPRAFRTDRLFRDLSVILSANLGKKEIEVLFDIDPALPKTLVCDDMRLQQVLINLGGNAVKFTSHGEVVLRVRVLESNDNDVLVEFAVKDSGIGIAPENQDHIFSGFSQAEASTTRRYGGTGLGLAISSRLTAMLGGELQLQSALGQGSTFYFSIRMALSPEQSTLEAPPSPMRMLVVDDNAVARELQRHMLQSMGWQVDTAASGPQALELVQSSLNGAEPYHAIFMDWQMPGMDGWETSQRIRSLTPPELLTLPTPLLLMVTAHGREMLTQRSVQDQALINGFLVKPVTASMLLDAVMEARSGIVLAAQGHNPTAAQTFIQPKRLSGLRLLVVEDNPVNQMVAQGLLSQEGADVTLADDGQLGVEAVASTQPPFDVVLMDVQMPVMDGYTATRTIRQKLGFLDLPIIAMTANAMASDRAACLAAGMNDHIGKPFDLDHLVATLLRFSVRAPQWAEPTPSNKELANQVPAETAAFMAAPDITPLEMGDFDAASALSRMGGNVELFVQVLQSFAQSMVLVPNQVAKYLLAHQDADCIRELHTLKGLASTVGARHLAQVARQLELRCKLRVQTSDVENIIASLQEAVEATARALQGVLAQYRLPIDNRESEVNRDSQYAALNKADLQRVLQPLIALLTQSDMQAMEVYAQFREAHGAALGISLDPLDRAMTEMEFEDALRAAQMLLVD